MKKSIVVGLLGLALLFFFSCKEKSADLAERGPVSFSFQSTKCMKNLTMKSSISDSIFLYSFKDTLIIDFSVIANCCPDSNRFSVSSIPDTDTIVVSVTDTAQSLCNCVCPYLIHAEFINLTNDHYVIRCTLGQTQGERFQIHLVDLYRDR